MRILIISKEGDGIGIAQRLAFEGNEVDFYCADAKCWRMGRGIVNRVAGWGTAARRADLIIADSVGLGRLAQQLRGLDTPLLGFSLELDSIELDRAKGQELFERAGIDTPPTWAFSSSADAARIGHANWSDSGCVVKPSGNAPNKLTAVCKDESQWDRACGALPPASRGIVQACVSGVEVSTEGWFNGRDFITPFNHTFEEKKFLVGDLGPTTGCQGNVVLRADSDKLTRATVELVSPFLATIGYRGPFDINCIVDSEKAYALEATSRLGYDAIDALLELLDEPAGSFFYDVARGRRSEMALSDDTAVAVRLSVPPWPHRKIDEREAGTPIDGINEDSLRHLFLCDVMKTGDNYALSACDGVVLKATARGRVAETTGPSGRPDLTREARRRVYRLLDRLVVPDKQYRTDIGDRVNKDVAQLREWGWI